MAIVCARKFHNNGGRNCSVNWNYVNEDCIPSNNLCDRQHSTLYLVWRDVQYLYWLQYRCFSFSPTKSGTGLGLSATLVLVRLHVSFIHCKVNDSHSLFEYVTLLGTV